MNKRIVILFLVFFVIGLPTVFAQEKVKVDTFESPDVKMKADVFMPAQSKGKLPVVFLAHNGFGKKEDWGTFPRELAGLGYLTVSIGWVDMDGTADVTKAIYLVLEKYRDVIDTDNAAFVGGCHGAAKFLTVLGNKTLMKKLNVKAAVGISVSETDQNMLKAAEKCLAPILVIYSNNDTYGYTGINKEFAGLVREPKKVMGLDNAPHGNEMLMYGSTKAAVSKEIVEWLKAYVK